MIQYNDVFNEEILNVLSICRCNYQKYLKAGQTKRHKDLRYLYQYIFDCTKVLSEDTKFSIRVFWVLNKWQEYPKCEVCGNILELPKSNKGFRLKVKDGELLYNWPRHCCRECAAGDIKTKEKQIQTYREKFGCDNPFQNEEIKKKRSETCIRNYGVAVPFKSDVIKKKYIQTMKERYGCENSFQLQKSKDAANSIEAKEKRNSSLSSYNMEKFGVPWFVMSDEFKSKANIESGTSKEEKELIAFLKTLTNEEFILGSFKIIYPKQLDIYIPTLNLAFEFNGTYFHSIEYLDDMNYHLNKTIMCEKQGIKLVHIWEDEWIYDNENVKRMINDIVKDIVVFPNNDILTIDRSKFNKVWKINGYKILEETKPELKLRSKKHKLKYLVADCGNLIYKKD